MRLLPTGTSPPTNALLVCRNARLNLLVLMALFWAIPVMWWWLEAPRIVIYFCLATALLLTPLIGGSWRKRRRPENWVLALDAGGAWINIRDCEYQAVELGNSVLFVPYDEIARVTKSVRRYTTPTGDGDVHHKEVLLDLELSRVEGVDLSELFQAERNLQTVERKVLGGLITVRDGRSRKQPVELEGEDQLRVKFNAMNYYLTPKISRALETLRPFVEVSEETEESNRDWRTLDEAGFNQLVRELVENGSAMRAKALLREKHGMSLREAREFVDEIRNQLTAVPSS